MAEAVAQTVTIHQPIDFAVAAALRVEGFTYKEIADKLKCNPNSLRVLMGRKGLPQATRKAVAAVVTSKRNAVAKAEEDASTRARNSLTAELQKQLDLLARQPVTYKDLPNTGQGRAAMTKTLAESLKIVHGWGNDSVTIQFGVSMLSEAAEPTPVIDVTSTVTKDEKPGPASEPQA